MLQTEAGFRLVGGLVACEAGSTFALHYSIDCDAAWRTRSAAIDGAVDRTRVKWALSADGRGTWRQGDAPAHWLAGALDVDFGFTPATNTLPLRRLDLSLGETAPVRSAWLRFPELRLELLEQTYTRLGAQTFRYEALVDGEPFSAQLDTDDYGRVLRYEGLWQAE